MGKVGFSKYDFNEWDVIVDGKTVGSLERERPTRYAAGARHGTVEDRTAPYRYWYVPNGFKAEHVELKAETLRDAKRELSSLLEA